jgi:hypothetical protein
MSETVFIVGLMASMVAMLVGLGVWGTRPPPPGPVRLFLGPPLSAGALVATLLAFAVGIAALGGLAVAAHGTVGHDGPLYVGWLLPWVVPGMMGAARWGLERSAPGQLRVEGRRLSLQWGAQRWDIPLEQARLTEWVETGGVGAWSVAVTHAGATHRLSVPLRGIVGERWSRELSDAGVSAPPHAMGGLMPIIADLREARALRAALFGGPP